MSSSVTLPVSLTRACLSVTCSHAWKHLGFHRPVPLLILVTFQMISLHTHLFLFVLILWSPRCILHIQAHSALFSFTNILLDWNSWSHGYCKYWTVESSISQLELNDRFVHKTVYIHNTAKSLGNGDWNMLQTNDLLPTTTTIKNFKLVPFAIRSVDPRISKNAVDAMRVKHCREPIKVHASDFSFNSTIRILYPQDTPGSQTTESFD